MIDSDTILEFYTRLEVLHFPILLCSLKYSIVPTIHKMKLIMIHDTIE